MGSKMFGQYAAISALFLGAAVANAAVQATFYVAPDGSDSNKGTKEAPFKTITQAQKAVRAINGSMTGDIEVILRDGTYQLPATVNFTEADGGKDGNYVRYKAADGENPLITGVCRLRVGPFTTRQKIFGKPKALRVDSVSFM